MRRGGALAAVPVLIVMAALGAGAWIGSRTGEDFTGGNPLSLGVAFFTFVGALIVWQRPDNRIGWLFAAVGALWVTGDAAARYSTYVYETGTGNTLALHLGAWYGEWYWLAFLLLTFSILPQVFPTGQAMPGPWRRVLQLALAFTSTMVLLAMLEDRLVLTDGDKSIPSPIGIPGLHDVEEGPIAGLLLLGGLSSVLAGMVSVVVRFRRSRGEERQQMKWFTFAVVLLIGEFVFQSAILDNGGGHRIPIVDGIAMALVPISAAVAIFRYRLYDIDVVINRALVYGALTAVLAGAYLGLVVLFQRVLSPLTADSDVAIAGSTLAVAALFRPVRARVQEFIDRRFYRHKYDASETLEEFATSLRDEVDLDSLSRELVGVVAETMQPAHASLWLRPGEAS